MKIFVTGGAGFIGSNFIRYVFESKDFSVVNFDKLTYAGNLANLESVADNPNYEGKIGEVYNIGGLDLDENLTLVRRILNLTGKPESLVSYVQDRPGHDRRYALNCKKIEIELGWRPAISLEDGLRLTIDWYKNSGHWLAGVRSREYLSYYEKYCENRASSLRAIARSGSVASD